MKSVLFRSFFQSICVLGYCVFPLVISALVMLLLEEPSPVPSLTRAADLYDCGLDEMQEDSMRSC